MKKACFIVALILFGYPLWGDVTSTRAATVEKYLQEKEPQPKYNEPGDLIDLIPVVRDINALIPRNFLLAHHHFSIAGDKMVIRHQNLDTRTQSSRKKAMIVFFYTGDMGTSMGTEVEMPLFYTSVIGLSDWYRYPMGNYQMTLNQSQTNGRDTFYIKAQTKF